MSKIAKNCKIVFVILFLSSFAVAGAQTKVVKGYVSTLNGLSVGNVDITAKKAASSVKSQPDGSFSIVCNTKDVLIFNGKVFNERKVKVDKQTTEIDVAMEFIQTPENMEIAIGYGYVSDMDRLNAAAKVFNEQGFCNYSNIFDLIRGLFPGVTMNSDCVILRGMSSINSSSCALYVVDGQILSSINHISPCDVKSIDMIKDGGAAIYGAQGANGVIIITLK